MALTTPSEWYFIRVNQSDINRQMLDQRIMNLPYFDTAVACSEIGKRTYRHHWHLLVKFTQPVLMQRADWQHHFGVSAWAIARNPNSPQSLTDYVDNIVEYMRKDGDWWEYE